MGKMLFGLICLVIGAAGTYFATQVHRPELEKFSPATVRIMGGGLTPGEPVTPYACPAHCTIDLLLEVASAGKCNVYMHKLVNVSTSTELVTWTVAASGPSPAYEFNFRNQDASDPPAYGVRIYDTVNYADPASAPPIWSPGASSATSVAVKILPANQATRLTKASAYDILIQYRTLNGPKPNPWIPCEKYDPVIINNGN